MTKYSYVTFIRLEHHTSICNFINSRSRFSRLVNKCTGRYFLLSVWLLLTYVLVCTIIVHCSLYSCSMIHRSPFINIQHQCWTAAERWAAGRWQWMTGWRVRVPLRYTNATYDEFSVNDEKFLPIFIICVRATRRRDVRNIRIRYPRTNTNHRWRLTSARSRNKHTLSSSWKAETTEWTKIERN